MKPLCLKQATALALSTITGDTNAPCQDHTEKTKGAVGDAFRSEQATNRSTETNPIPENRETLKTKRGLEIWEALLNFLQKEYCAITFQKCFASLKFIKISDKSIVLSAPNKAIRSFILQTYFYKIHDFLTSNYKEICIIEVLIEQVDNRSNDNQPVLVKVEESLLSNDNKYEQALPKSKSISSSPQLNQQLTITSLLNESLIFDNFIYGLPNKIAYNAAKELSTRSSALNINSLCINGDIGMGKTHLLQSIAHKLMPQIKVAYFTCDKFSREYVKAVRSNKLSDFKYYLASLDMLLLDDLQFICGKQGTERELINIFDSLMEVSKKIVVSCNQHPSELNMDPRAKSRFASCLTVDIEKSTFDLRMRILEHKFAQNNIAKAIGINYEMLYLIAYHVDNNIRELEGALNKIIAYCQLAEIKANPELIHDLVVNRYNASHNYENRSISYEAVVKVVSDYFSIDQLELKSRSRTAKISHARQVAAYLMKEIANMSVKQIGNYLGNRDHSTVVYMIKALRSHSNAVRMQQLDEIRKICLNYNQKNN